MTSCSEWQVCTEAARWRHAFCSDWSEGNNPFITSCPTEDDIHLADNGFGPLNAVVLRVILFSLNGYENGSGECNSGLQHAHVSETIFQDAKLDQPPKRCAQLPKLQSLSVESLLLPGNSCLVSTLNPATLPAQNASLWIIFCAQGTCSVRLSYS